MIQMREILYRNFKITNVTILKVLLEKGTTCMNRCGLQQRDGTYKKKSNGRARTKKKNIRN